MHFLLAAHLKSKKNKSLDISHLLFSGQRINASVYRKRRNTKEMADPKVVQYTLAVFYLFVGVLIVVLAFTMPQMTTSNSCIFAFLGIFILIASILQLVSIP